MSESDFPLPPPTFEFLVFSLKMQAEIRMGVMRMPGEEQVSTDLRAARHAIDTLAMVQEKTRGNLSMEEQRLIENSLTELRFRFVQASEDAAKAAASAAAPVENAELRNEPKSQE
jgi:Domain of unknown function (DUF1844)